MLPTYRNEDFCGRGVVRSREMKEVVSWNDGDEVARVDVAHLEKVLAERKDVRLLVRCRRKRAPSSRSYISFVLASPLGQRLRHGPNVLGEPNHSREMSRDALPALLMK